MPPDQSNEKTIKHLAIYLPSLRGGGAERVIVNLAGAFVKRGYHVDLVLIKASGPYLNEVHPDINIVDLDTYRFFIALPKLAQYLRRTKPDVLLSTIDTANIVAICAKQVSGVSTRVVVRISNMLSTKETHSRLKHRFVHSIAKYVYPYADHIVAVSNGVRDDLVENIGISADKISTIYNPSVTDEMLNKIDEKIDHPWFTQDVPIILGVGEFTKQKDFETLLRAFKNVLLESNARLILLGTGPQEEYLRTITNELNIGDQVSMPGFVENPYKYMSKADIFVLSSRWEGCPNVLIEALACGAPVIATDCPSGPSEILEEGKWGTLVPVGDVDILSTEIKTVIQNGDNRDSKKYARTRFSLENISCEYENILRRPLNETDD